MGKNFSGWNFRLISLQLFDEICEIICCVEQQKIMGFRIVGIVRRTSFSTTQAASKRVDVPKGYAAVYVGDKMRQFMIPISYLNQPLIISTIT